jgi:hypothetical protein
MKKPRNGKPSGAENRCELQGITAASADLIRRTRRDTIGWTSDPQ